MKANWNKTNSNEIIKLLEMDSTIQKLQTVATRYSSFELCAGAIISIINGEKPKDYDLLNMKSVKLRGIKGVNFVDSSSTAETYSMEDVNEENQAIIQLLKRDRSEFEYTASKMYAKIHEDKITLHGFDDPTFDNLILIPVSYSKVAATNCLLRLPHWIKKGFTIPDKTYISLVRAATKTRLRVNS